VTGIGRFCLSCKGLPTYSRRSIRTTSKSVKAKTPSKSDVNKLLSFSESPEKYATGTNKAKEKVRYLDSIQHKLSDNQQLKYDTARKEYEILLEAKEEGKKKLKRDYSPVLREGLESHVSVRIRYKSSWRTIDPYSLSETYVVAYCHSARDLRTFRVDRIQDIELLDITFKSDKNLQSLVEGKLDSASSYRGYRRGYSYYND